MSDKIAIKVCNVSKKHCKYLKKSMFYGIKDIGRNMLGLSSHSNKLRYGEFWAVNNVSFDVNKGETLGIMGPNGSGKSTLLKMINGIFWPDTGKISTKGRVSALIEIGSGFHPLLTGCENIYLNAAILGLNKRDVDDKLEDIIKFADIGDFIDTPVKFYSSGMFVRLGFAVAVHCEPDVLLVDEVLAVGDGPFRNKCYKKLNELKDEKNVAVVFVSHDLYRMETFCDKGFLIIEGKERAKGEVHEVIGQYQSILQDVMGNQQNISEKFFKMPSTKDIKIIDVKFLNGKDKEQNIFNHGDFLKIRIEYNAKKKVVNPKFQFEIWTWDGRLISVFGPHFNHMEIPAIEMGKGMIECWIDKLAILANKYYIDVGIFDKTRTITLDWWEGRLNSKLTFHIKPNWISEMMGQWIPIVHLNNKWTVNDKQLYRD